jgi:murein DD-endopeptidase MepM/ murein hydrolase activator NlpD
MPPCSLRHARLGVVAVVLASTVAPLAVAPAAGANWLRPVPGAVERPFDYGRDPFAPGQHRGVDLAAPPGASVRSACDGVVAFAGRTPRHGRVVSVRCVGRRISYLPLRSTAVRRGDPIGRGDRVGTVGDGHGRALHVGVRSEAHRFGYVDPLDLFGTRRPRHRRCCRASVLRRAGHRVRGPARGSRRRSGVRFRAPPRPLRRGRSGSAWPSCCCRRRAGGP